MASTTPYTPAHRTCASNLVEAIIAFFVGAILQIGRLAYLLVLRIQRIRARRAFRAQATNMGERMAQAGVADQHLLDRLKTIPERNREERAKVLMEMGELGLEPGVPPLGLEDGYAAGHQAYQSVRKVENAFDQTANQLLPHSALGWFALLFNYVITISLAILLVAYVAPASVPDSLRNLIGKGTETPITMDASFDAIKVEIIEAMIARTDLKDGNDHGALVVDERMSFRLKIRVTNTGSPPVAYETWRGKFTPAQDSAAKVIDDRGITLARVVNKNDTPPEGGILSRNIAPGESVEDVLIYAPPEPKFKNLTVYLPGNNVGIQEETRQITIPAKRVKMPESYR